MHIPTGELIRLMLHNYHYVCAYLKDIPTIDTALSMYPNSVLLKHYGVIHTADGVLRSRQCAINDLQYLYHTGRMKIEQILGYSASDIASWDDATLIKHCEEHFQYTRPASPPPSTSKVKTHTNAPTHDKEKDALEGIVDLTKPARKKRVTAIDDEKASAIALLQSLLKPEQLKAIKEYAKQ